MRFASAGTSSLTFYPVTLAYLVNQLCGYARINFLSQLISNRLLGQASGNHAANLINRVIYAVGSHTVITV